jgi:hypothetical protein
VALLGFPSPFANAEDGHEQDLLLRFLAAGKNKNVFFTGPTGSVFSL